MRLEGVSSEHGPAAVFPYHTGYESAADINVSVVKVLCWILTIKDYKKTDRTQLWLCQQPGV